MRKERADLKLRPFFVSHVERAGDDVEDAPVNAVNQSEGRTAGVFPASSQTLFASFYLGRRHYGLGKAYEIMVVMRERDVT